MNQIEQIKIGNRFWLSTLGGWIALIGIIFFLLFLLILNTGNGLPPEMSFIYYVEIMHDNVYYGFSLSIITSLIGFWLFDLRNSNTTELIIDNDRIEFVQNGEKVDLPRQKILKLVKLKSSYPVKDIKVRIRTNGMKKYIIKMETSVYNKLIEIYSDRYYEK